MRITRFLDSQGQVRFGIDRGDKTAEILTGDLLGQTSVTPAQRLRPTGQTTSIHKVLAPLAATHIICVGANYREHIAESGGQVPDYPVLFMKPNTAQIAPGEAIRIPACCTHGPEVDYECELAVVIGKTTRNVSEADALEYVLGYTAANDVSARWWQKQGGGGQFVRGKSFDTFCPLGPVLVTPDEIPDPQTLGIKTILNGQVMQNHNTRDMLFNVRKLISFISQDTTILPGTVILTGTPQGVGMARKPPVFLKAGDEVVIEVEKIGRLVNPVA